MQAQAGKTNVPRPLVALAAPLVSAMMLADAPGPVSSKTINCSLQTQTSCPMYADGCFDYSPQYCQGGQALVPRSAKTEPPPPKALQAPAKLWSDGGYSPPGQPAEPSLSPAAILRLHGACDVLDPVEASLCYCAGATADWSKECPGITRDAAKLARGAILAPVT